MTLLRRSFRRKGTQKKKTHEHGRRELAPRQRQSGGGCAHPRQPRGPSGVCACVHACVLACGVSVCVCACVRACLCVCLLCVRAVPVACGVATGVRAVRAAALQEEDRGKELCVGRAQVHRSSLCARCADLCAASPGQAFLHRLHVLPRSRSRFPALQSAGAAWAGARLTPPASLPVSAAVPVVRACAVIHAGGGPLGMGDIEDINGQACLNCSWHHYKVRRSFCARVHARRILFVLIGFRACVCLRA